MGSAGRPDCRLCDDAEHALSLDDGKPITIWPHVDLAEWCDDDGRPLMCTHSLDGNMRELKRLIEGAGGEEWILSPTGYGEEIDGPDYD